MATQVQLPERPASTVERLHIEETEAQRIERMGRERPPSLKSGWSEIGFVVAIAMSQILTEYFVSGFNILLPTLITELNIPGASSVWPATSFSLAIASTLLFFGRLGDIYGGYVVFMSGLGWLIVWSTIAGFSQNWMMMVFCRALQGLGPAAFLPTGVQLIGSTYRPGPRKNIVFSIYGAAAVAGFFIGIFFAGVVAQFTQFGWYFWIGAILTAITFAISYSCIPSEHSQRPKTDIEIDWIGSGLIISGVILLVFSITESAHIGWGVAYIPTLFTMSVVLLLVAVYFEGWVAKSPLLPPDVFTVPCMTPLFFAIFVLYGTLGIYLLFGTEYFQYVLDATPLQVVAWYTPMAIGGVILAISEGFLLAIVPGRILLMISGCGAFGAHLLLALMPVGASYWAYLLPSMILGTIGIDLSITLVMVFVTTQLPLSRQGLAGGFVNSVLQLGMAIAIGLTDIIRTKTEPYAGQMQSYKNVFWFGVAAGVLSLIILTIYGKVPRAKSDYTADELADLRKESEAVET
ncbi:hypothetical protein LTR70_006841 [Exophiala xenobiotica]|uniref:Major facilitator superfamily (MFS) profile domain-containing protein n=1 Tax=Lithohypha guttulata TaxID=1690604 RepID=A0ABR0K6E1_9EURO|nr:hypothetical protein LTR24_006450 [Lithohypha guttulata]KAK5315188.1 hypothetical protein LTR70_006841 [Exophiala xenobiotica]